MSIRTACFAAALALGALIAPTAMADEVWSLPSGNQLVYDRDVGNVAVLTYRAAQGLQQGQIFVVGLGGVSEGRTHYQAYWVEADDAGPACPAAIVDAEGHTWHRWGLATLSFASRTFPSRITLSRGECLAAPHGSVTGRPVVGAGVR